jgi:hypothetical protein
VLSGTLKSDFVFSTMTFGSKLFNSDTARPTAPVRRVQNLANNLPCCGNHDLIESDNNQNSFTQHMRNGKRRQIRLNDRNKKSKFGIYSMPIDVARLLDN